MAAIDCATEGIDGGDNGKESCQIVDFIEIFRIFFYFSLLSTANDFYFHQNSPNDLKFQLK